MYSTSTVQNGNLNLKLLWERFRFFIMIDYRYNTIPELVKGGLSGYCTVLYTVD